MICHIALTMSTEVDIVAEIGGGETMVEVLDDGDVICCAPCDNLVALIVVFACSKLSFLGMEIDHYGDMGTVAHGLKLGETGIEWFAVLADA